MRPTGPHHLQIAETESRTRTNEPDSLCYLAAPGNSVHENYKQNWRKGTALAETNPNGSGSDLLPAMQTKL